MTPTSMDSEHKKQNIALMNVGEHGYIGAGGKEEIREGGVEDQTIDEQGDVENDIGEENMLTGAFLSKQQASDEDIGPVIKKLQDPKERIVLTQRGERLWKIRASLVLRGGVLLRKFRFGAGRRPIEQIVLPNAMKDLVMESLHDNIFSGHFGVKKTQTRVKLRYYWPGCMNDVEEWCRTCVVCQRRKPPTSKNVAPLQSIDTGQGPFEQLALDIVKLPKTARGNQYALVIEDYFSKWVEVFPLARTVAPSVAQCVLNGWICRFGCPYTILSDQGSEFESHLFQCLNDTLQTHKLRTSTYHPRTDGMVERSNRTLIDVLSKYAETEPNWDLRLPLVLFAIRTSEHTSTKFSPFRLIYGQEARLPWDIVYGLPTNQPLPHEQWVAERKKDMIKVFGLVREHTKTAQLHQKRYYDKNLKGKFQVFEVGDLVLMCDPACWARRVEGRLQGKLNSPWNGPFKVTEKLSEALYKIEKPDGEVVVNTERLKRYHQRDNHSHEDPEVLEESSDEEDNDILLHDPDEERELNPGQGVVLRESPQRIPQPTIDPAQQPRDIQEWGHRGNLRCNLDPANIMEGPRNRGNKH